MKKKLAIPFVILLIGAIFFMKDKLNQNPIPKSIWIEKGVSKNPFLRPNSQADTVLVLEVKGDFLQSKSTYYGLIENYNIKSFVAKYERCLECRIDSIPLFKKEYK